MNYGNLKFSRSVNDHLFLTSLNVISYFIDNNINKILFIEELFQK